MAKPGKQKINFMISKKTKIGAAAVLQLGLIASIGDYVGWPYMNYVLGMTIAAFILTLLSLIIDLAKD
jgi:hypothetical protein